MKETQIIPRHNYDSRFIFDFEKQVKEIVNREAEGWYANKNSIPNQFIKKEKLNFSFRSIIKMFKP